MSYLLPGWYGAVGQHHSFAKMHRVLEAQGDKTVTRCGIEVHVSELLGDLYLLHQQDTAFATLRGKYPDKELRRVWNNTASRSIRQLAKERCSKCLAAFSVR